MMKSTFIPQGYRKEYFDSIYGSIENLINPDNYPANWDIDSLILKNNISVFYAPVTNTTNKKDFSLWLIYQLIKSDRLKKYTNNLRSISNKKENRAYKSKNFPYATFSGIFRTRKDIDLIEHSGFICIDLDHLAERLSEVKKKINSLNETVMSFVSPNGDGLKVIFRIDQKFSQGEYYKAISDHLKSVCNLSELNIDNSCKDISRACFLCYDPEIFINPKLSWYE